MFQTNDFNVFYGNTKRGQNSGRANKNVPVYFFSPLSEDFIKFDFAENTAENCLLYASPIFTHLELEIVVRLE